MTDVLRILIAPLLWLATFSATYGLHGLLCGHDIAGQAFGMPLPRLALIAAFTLALLLQMALLAAITHPRLASRSGFVRFVSRATGWTSLVATGWTLLPIVTTTSCM